MQGPFRITPHIFLIRIISTVIKQNHTMSFALPVALLKLTLFKCNSRAFICNPTHECVCDYVRGCCAGTWEMANRHLWKLTEQQKESPCCQITFSCRFTTSLFTMHVFTCLDWKNLEHSGVRQGKRDLLLTSGIRFIVACLLDISLQNV